MKLSKETMTVLKNFSQINKSLLIKPGKKLISLSEQKVIMAVADTDESFPKEAGIWDLNMLLSVLSLFEEPDIEFFDSFLTIQSGKNKVMFKYCDPSLIVYLTKTFTMPSTALQFVFTESDFRALIKASSICSLPNMRLVGSGKNGKIELYDAKDESSNTFALDVDVNAEDGVTKYNIVFLVNNLQFINDDYDVVVGTKHAVKFVSRNHPVEYVVTMEATSTIEN